MSDPISDAIRAAAAHCGVPLDRLTRDQFRAARRAGVHSISDWQSRDWGACRSRAVTPLPTLPDRHYVRGVSSLIGRDGSLKAQWVKTDLERETRAETINRIFAELSATITPREVSVAPPTGLPEDLLAVYPIGDAHLGMLAWRHEAGQDHDLRTASRLVRAAFDELTSREPRTATALILNLGDFFHADSGKNETPAGTRVDVDGRYARVYREGLELMVYVIDRALERHQTVVVENRVGNHDRDTSMQLSVGLELYYRSEPRVEVNVTPGPFFYRRFGRCLIGSTHGDMTRKTDLQKIMSVDRRKDWGQIEHAYWYLGHEHHTRRVEDYGCIVEVFRTLAPSDLWHSAKGYRSGRDLTRIVLHNRDGEVSRSMISAGALERRWRENKHH